MSVNSERTEEDRAQWWPYWLHWGQIMCVFLLSPKYAGYWTRKRKTSLVITVYGNSIRF